MIINPYWLSGLIDGEGSFGISISKRVSPVFGKVSHVVSTTFYLGLHGKDLFVQEAIQAYFGCGYITTAGKKSGFFHSYQIRANNDNLNILIPHQDKYPLCGTKRLDYLDYRHVVLMISNGEHLTPQGQAQIRKIKAGMNRGRIF